MKINTNNIFLKFIDLLGVKHTSRFSNKYFTEHPDNNNLLGLSDMLSHYGIKSTGIKIEEDKEEALSTFTPPFATYVGRKFGIVFRVTDSNVFFWNEKEMILSKDNFLSLWNGVVLVTETNENSIEPEYNLHRKEDIIYHGKKILFLVTFILWIGLMIYSSDIYLQINLLVALFINFLGLGITYLLIIQQIGLQNKYVEKICSVFHQSSCNGVLESKASKLFGIFSWSEIGFSYFISNIWIILFFSASYPYAAIINVCTLPFTIWSIWYQKEVVKQWCPLCLLVQLIIWGLFITNLSFEMIIFPAFTLNSILQTGCIYILPVLLSNFLVSGITNTEKVQLITHKLNVIKADEEIFKAVINKEVQYKINKSTSSIIWGNKNAKNLITIITNPYCSPCGKMHFRLKQLLADTNTGYCIQYILTSFNRELENGVKLFISVYQQEDLENFMTFLDDWYSTEKHKRNLFFNKYPFDPKNEKILLELQRQKNWINTNLEMFSTPTILLNGYKLPDSYKIEDLVYFTDIEFNEDE